MRKYGQRRWPDRKSPLAVSRLRRAHSISTAAPSVALASRGEALHGEERPRAATSRLQEISWGSRNRAPTGLDPVDAVAVIHDHCAVYTGSDTVEILLDLVGWSEKKIAVGSKLLEPACGDGSFLLPAIRRLLSWARTRPEAELEGMIRAYEFDTGTVNNLHQAIVALLRENGRSQKSAERLADTWVRCEDFLLSDPSFASTHVVGNPPYMRWSLVPLQLRRSYEAALPKAAARGDLCLGFLWKATQFATGEGSRIGFLCADRWLRCAYGQDVRILLADSHSLRTHIEVHGLPVFKGDRKVGAYAAVTVLERSAREIPTKFGKACSIPNLRKLASVEQTDRQDYHSIWPTQRAGGARLASHGVREILEVVDRNSLLLADAGVAVRCGTALGAAKAFVVSADVDIEPDRMLPYVSSRDVTLEGGVSPVSFVANVWTDQGALVDLSSVPLLARHLQKFKKILESRACVSGSADWYRTIDKLHIDRISEPKVIVAGMSRRAKVAYDPGGHVASNALYCLVSNQWPLHALATSLRAGILDLFGEVLSPRFSGGTKRFDGNVLRQVRLPEWGSVSVGLRRRIEGRDIAEGFDAGLIADLFRLRASAHRKALEQLLTGVEETTRPRRGAS